MEDESATPTSQSLSRLKTEWLELEKELSTRFDALTDHFRRVDEGVVDPAEVAKVMRAEIDGCLDRLNRIKGEMGELWRKPDQRP